MASKHRDIGLKFRHRSTPNTRRVTKNVGFGGGYHIYIYIPIIVISQLLVGGGSPQTKSIVVQGSFTLQPKVVFHSILI